MSSMAFLGVLLAALTGQAADTLAVATVLPVDALLPAELVASQVRSVLRDHTNTDAWQELAGSLPEMIVRGGGDVASLFEAARLAEEMSGTSSESPVAEALVPPLDSPPAAAVMSMPAFSWPSWLDIRRLTRFYDNGVAFVIWVAMALLGVLVLPRFFRRGGTGATGATAPPAPVRARVRDARALAGQGRSIPEISRETRLAREALSVLLQPHVG